MSALDQCMRCRRRAASCRIKVGLGKFTSQESFPTGDIENYEGPILELSVCRRCYRLYHLTHDLERKVPLILIIVPLGYAAFGYFYYEAATAVILAISSFFAMLLLVGLFMWIVDGKIVRWMLGPERFAKKHPAYSEFREDGFKHVFYIDRSGVVESKFTLVLEDLQ